jgi:hypothetical protein
MSASEEVSRHIHGSLLDLRRRVDTEIAIEVARAVAEGAARALEDLVEELDRIPGAPPSHVILDLNRSGAFKH